MRFAAQFFGSVSSAAQYRLVRARASYEMLYSFLLVLIISFLMVVQCVALLHGELFTARADKPAVFDDVVRQIASQLPVMTLQNHKLVTREGRPHSIRVGTVIFGHPLAGTIATIDTTGTTTRDSIKTPVLVTAKEVIVQSKNKTETYPLSDYTKEMPSSLVINRALIDDVAATLIRTVHDHLVKAYLILGSIGWLMLLLVLYILRITMLMVLGLAGWLLGKMMRIATSYRQAVSLAAISYTPVAVADLAMFVLFHRSAPTWMLLLGGVVMLTVAIRVSRATATPEPS